MQILSAIKRVKPDWFILGLFAMILLAYIMPAAGGSEGLLPLKEISQYGVSLIFFFYGLGLNGQKLKAGLHNWKLHLSIHSSTFIIFPALALLPLPFIHTEEQMLLWLAFFYLATLPSTVSSSVVMVSIAGGNIPAAIFNASISGLIGIFVTPLLMNIFLTTQGAAFNLPEVLGKLAFQILLPVFLGVVLNRYLGKLAEMHKSSLRLFDKAVILLIVYNSFSHSFKTGIFEQTGVGALLLLAAGAVAMFFMVYYIISLLSKLFQFSREDRITALFCGSKKSLVHGSVFASVLFSGMEGAGLFLLPIMIYHAFQLFYVSILARSMQRRAKADKDVKPIIAP